MARQPFDNAAQDLLAVLASIPKQKLAILGGHVRWMSSDPIESSIVHSVVEIALSAVHVRNSVQPAIEFGEMNATLPQIRSPRMSGVTRARHDRRYSGSGAKIEKIVAGFLRKDGEESSGIVGDRG